MWTPTAQTMWRWAPPNADYLVTFPFRFLFNNVGRVVVYSGATGLSLHSWYGNFVGGTEFGFAMTGAGDVDGDGFDDILTSAPKADGPALQAGIVKLYSGSSRALMQTFWGLQTDARFDHSIDGGTDIDGDGILDLLVGSPYENADGSFGGGGEEGAVRIFSCSDGTLLWADLWNSDYDISGTYPGPYTKDQIDAGQHGASGAPLGDVLASIGDFDGDGIPDLFSGSPTGTIGLPFGFAEAGLAKIFSAASGSVLRSLGSGTSYDHFGTSLAGGDLDGDGLPDVVAGIPGADGSALDVGTAAIYPGHGCVARWLTYGTGHPGTLGIPGLSATADPVIDASLGICVGNSLGALTTAFLFVGLSATSVPLKEGTLLVDPLLTITFVLPPGSTTLAATLPDDPLLCGVSLYLQVAEADHGASAGASFSKGLELAIGY
ncbi:MAG: hypothetical protein ACI9EF_003433 [Pseudohongiellaceae bacterium]|jgi:hypothetical protein